MLHVLYRTAPLLMTMCVEGDSSALIAPSLLSGWKAAEAGRPDFVIHRGILCHKDQVEGQPVCQLCVPMSRRASVLKLAHDSVFMVIWEKGRPGNVSVCPSSGLSYVSLL